MSPSIHAHARWHPQHDATVRECARANLLASIASGPLRAAWLEHRAEVRDVTPAEFVDLLERIADDAWADALIEAEQEIFRGEWDE